MELGVFTMWSAHNEYKGSIKHYGIIIKSILV